MTDWVSHIRIAVAAMEAGKYARWRWAAPPRWRNAGSWYASPCVPANLYAAGKLLL